MRRAALALAVLAFTASVLPVEAQPLDGGGLPCWSFCQLWMGGPGGNDGLPRPSYRQPRWAHWRPASDARDRTADNQIGAGRAGRRRFVRRHRPIMPVVVAARPTTGPAAAAPVATPKIVPVAAAAVMVPTAVTPAVVAPAVVARPRSAADVPAAPLE